MNEPKQGEEIDFYYLKSSDFRNYHADGIAGGKTPSGDLYMTVYVERLAIPQRERFKIHKDGHLGEMLEIEGKKGIIRDVECGIILKEKTALALRNWLNEQLDEKK